MAGNDYYTLLRTTSNICNYFDKHHIDILRRGIHKLFICVGDGEIWKDEDGEVRLKELISILKGFLTDGYMTLNFHTKHGFVHYNCGDIIKDSYIVGEKCLETEKEKSYLRRVKAFQGEIQFLNKEETANFYAALEEFYLFDDRINWNKKLKKWKKCAKSGLSINGEENDLKSRTVQSYFQLLKFIETCCIIRKTLNRLYGIAPTWMLFESDQVPFFVDAYGAINPFEEINAFFAKDNADSLKNRLSTWMTAAKTKGKIWEEGEPVELIEFYERMNFIIETSWMLHDSYYLLEDWLDPETFSTIYMPIPEPSGSFRPDETKLSDEEVEAPVLFLQHCLFDSSVVCERETLNTLFKSALSKELKAEDQGWLHEKLPMMIDALYILNAWIFERSKK